MMQPEGCLRRQDLDIFRRRSDLEEDDEVQKVRAEDQSRNHHRESALVNPSPPQHQQPSFQPTRRLPAMVMRNFNRERTFRAPSQLLSLPNNFLHRRPPPRQYAPNHPSPTRGQSPYQSWPSVSRCQPTITNTPLTSPNLPEGSPSTPSTQYPLLSSVRSTVESQNSCSPPKMRKTSTESPSSTEVTEIGSRAATLVSPKRTDTLGRSDFKQQNESASISKPCLVTAKVPEKVEHHYKVRPIEFNNKPESKQSRCESSSPDPSLHVSKSLDKSHLASKRVDGQETSVTEQSASRSSAETPGVRSKRVTVENPRNIHCENLRSEEKAKCLKKKSQDSEPNTIQMDNSELEILDVGIRRDSLESPQRNFKNAKDLKEKVKDSQPKTLQTDVVIELCTKTNLEIEASASREKRIPKENPIHTSFQKLKMEREAKSMKRGSVDLETESLQTDAVKPASASSEVEVKTTEVGKRRGSIEKNKIIERKARGLNRKSSNSKEKSSQTDVTEPPSIVNSEDELCHLKKRRVSLVNPKNIHFSKLQCDGEVRGVKRRSVDSESESLQSDTEKIESVRRSSTDSSKGSPLDPEVESDESSRSTPDQAIPSCRKNSAEEQTQNIAMPTNNASKRKRNKRIGVYEKKSVLHIREIVKLGLKPRDKNMIRDNNKFSLASKQSKNNPNSTTTSSRSLDKPQTSVKNTNDPKRSNTTVSNAQQLSSKGSERPAESGKVSSNKKASNMTDKLVSAKNVKVTPGTSTKDCYTNRTRASSKPSTSKTSKTVENAKESSGENSKNKKSSGESSKTSHSKKTESSNSMARKKNKSKTEQNCDVIAKNSSGQETVKDKKKSGSSKSQKSRGMNDLFNPDNCVPKPSSKSHHSAESASNNSSSKSKSGLNSNKLKKHKTKNNKHTTSHKSVESVESAASKITKHPLAATRNNDVPQSVSTDTVAGEDAIIAKNAQALLDILTENSAGEVKTPLKETPGKSLPVIDYCTVIDESSSDTCRSSDNSSQRVQLEVDDTSSLIPSQSLVNTAEADCELLADKKKHLKTTATIQTKPNNSNSITLVDLVEDSDDEDFHKSKDVNCGYESDDSSIRLHYSPSSSDSQSTVCASDDESLPGNTNVLETESINLNVDTEFSKHPSAEKNTVESSSVKENPATKITRTELLKESAIEFCHTGKSSEDAESPMPCSKVNPPTLAELNIATATKTSSDKIESNSSTVDEQVEIPNAAPIQHLAITTETISEINPCENSDNNISNCNETLSVPAPQAETFPAPENLECTPASSEEASENKLDALNLMLSTINKDIINNSLKQNEYMRHLAQSFTTLMDSFIRQKKALPNAVQAAKLHALRMVDIINHWRMIGNKEFDAPAVLTEYFKSVETPFLPPEVYTHHVTSILSSHLQSLQVNNPMIAAQHKAAATSNLNAAPSSLSTNPLIEKNLNALEDNGQTSSKSITQPAIQKSQTLAANSTRSIPTHTSSELSQLAQFCQVSSQDQQGMAGQIRNTRRHSEHSQGAHASQQLSPQIAQEMPGSNNPTQSQHTRNNIPGEMQSTVTAQVPVAPLQNEQATRTSRSPKRTQRATKDTGRGRGRQSKPQDLTTQNQPVQQHQQQQQQQQQHQQQQQQQQVFNCGPPGCPQNVQGAPPTAPLNQPGITSYSQVYPNAPQQPHMFQHPSMRISHNLSDAGNQPISNAPYSSQLQSLLANRTQQSHQNSQARSNANLYNSSQLIEGMQRAAHPNQNTMNPQSGAGSVPPIQMQQRLNLHDAMVTSTVNQSLNAPPPYSTPFYPQNPQLIRWQYNPAANNTHVANNVNHGSARVPSYARSMPQASLNHNVNAPSVSAACQGRIGRNTEQQTNVAPRFYTPNPVGNVIVQNPFAEISSNERPVTEMPVNSQSFSRVSVSQQSVPQQQALMIQQEAYIQTMQQSNNAVANMIEHAPHPNMSHNNPVMNLAKQQHMAVQQRQRGEPPQVTVPSSVYIQQQGLAPHTPEINVASDTRVRGGSIPNVAAMFQTNQINSAVSHHQQQSLFAATEQPTPLQTSHFVQNNNQGAEVYNFSEAQQNPCDDPSLVQPCLVCKKPADNQCSVCHLVFYCTVECQTADWDIHRRVCQITAIPTTGET